MTVTLTQDYERIIALVSDLHVGSRFGLCPKNWIGKEGGEISASMNRGQESLLKSWREYCNVIDSLKADSVFIVGDVCAGTNPKEQGVYMMTTDLDEQVEAAIKVLEPLTNNRAVGVWSGSPYHESRDMRLHKFVAEALGGKFFGAVANVRLQPSNKIINVAHKTTEAIVYPETALSRDIMFLKEAEALGKLYKTHAIIRGHRHSYVEIHKYDLHYVSLPCWQAYVPFDYAVKWYFRFQPDIGGAVLFLDSEERLRFWHFLYETPHIADSLEEM